MRQPWMQHLLAVLGFFLVCSAYFHPALGGKMLVQGDTFKYVAMSREVREYREATGEEPLWTNSIFGGMPAYQISMEARGNYFLGLTRIIPRPISFCFVAMLGAYVLLISLGANRWAAFAAGLAYGLSTYLITFIEAGHNSKSDAVALMPLVLAGLNYLFQGRYALGLVFAGVAMALQVTVNHLQITYYMFLLIGIWALFEGFRSWREKQLPRFAAALGLFALVSALAVGSNATRILTTLEYTPWTIRGPSELSRPPDAAEGAAVEQSGSGLDRDYAFDWSYGIGETLTLLFANYAGGASQMNFIAEEDSESLESLRRMMSSGQLGEQEAQQLAQLATKYWGALTFTGGPIYLGAVVIFLALIGCVLAPARYRGWLIAGTVFSLMLGWGRNFAAFNYLLFDYLPLYNKFRTVMMAVVIADLTLVVLAGLALHQLLFGEAEPQRKRRALFIGGGAVLLLSLIPLSAGALYTPEYFREAGIAAENPKLIPFLDAIHSDRVAMIRADALRTLGLVALAFGLLWLALAGKLPARFAAPLLALLLVGDLMSINVNYLNQDNFEDPDYYTRTLNQNLPVIQDQSLHYRVWNQNARLDQDGMTSYAYRTVGGYHGAKSRRYQDLISSNSYTLPLPILNMLNTRYVIGRENRIQVNPAALGNAWTVDSLIWTRSADEELAATNRLNPAQAAVLREEDRERVRVPQPGSAPGRIELVAYQPNELTYRVDNPNEVFAVFSEVWYRGNTDWVAYLDGQQVDHIRVNYILRGMSLPAGQHELVFRFDPPSFRLGVTLSRASSGLLWLLVAGSLVLWYRRDARARA